MKRLFPLYRSVCIVALNIFFLYFHNKIKSHLHSFNSKRKLDIERQHTAQKNLVRHGCLLIYLSLVNRKAIIKLMLAIFGIKCTVMLSFSLTHQADLQLNYIQIRSVDVFRNSNVSIDPIEEIFHHYHECCSLHTLLGYVNYYYNIKQSIQLFHLYSYNISQ